MKTKFGLIILFAFATIALSAQTNKTSITYDLTRTFVSNPANVGGELVVPDSPNTIKVCSSESQTSQSIYSGKLLNTAFINLDNRTSSCCVTIVVVSAGVTQKVTVPVGGISGVLGFSKVTSISITIDQKMTNTFPETATAKGAVDFWF